MRRPLLALMTIVLAGGDRVRIGRRGRRLRVGDVDSIPDAVAAASAIAPRRPVKITLLSPASGSTVQGTSVLVRVSVTGGEVTPTVTSDITPTKGHVHLYLNNQLIYMSYTLQQEITVKPGVEYSMYAEFVAQDHFPFSPRDVTPTIFFTVAPA